MSFQLVVIQGGRSNAPAVKIGSGVTTVGRQEDCQFRIASSMVSRKHCQIADNQGRLVIKDLGSSNGTLVNGKKVVDQQTLSPGDMVTIGPVVFRVEVMDGSSVAPSKASKPGDTAVAQAIAIGDDDMIPIEIADDAVTHLSPAPDKAAVAHGAAAPQSSPASIPIEETPASQPEVGEDAVIDFLLNIELDEEDKP